MNTQKEVYKMLFKESKTELSTQKIELARKPQSVLNDIKKLDAKLKSEEGKIDKIYLNYKNAQKEFVKLMDDINSELDKYDDDLKDIRDAAKELGVDSGQIDGFTEAFNLMLQITKISNQNKKLYPSV